MNNFLILINIFLNTVNLFYFMHIFNACTLFSYINIKKNTWTIVNTWCLKNIWTIFLSHIIFKMLEHLFNYMNILEICEQFFSYNLQILFFSKYASNNFELHKHYKLYMNTFSNIWEYTWWHTDILPFCS